MKTIPEIRIILEQLEHQAADKLESQDLDFKEWNPKSMQDSVHLVIEMAVCMANGGGGTVIFGVNDKKIGMSEAIIGVPEDVDVNRIKKAVYDSTDPKLTPVFEELDVRYGTGRLIAMQVFPGLPPYTDTSGRAKIRIGKECQPLTGTLRSQIMAETGSSDFTLETVSETIETSISPSALEILRDAAQREKAPEDLLQLSDQDLLFSLGLIQNQQLTRAVLLLAGKESIIKKHFPGYVWTYLRLTSDTDYSDRMDGKTAIPVALGKIIDRIMTENPITTIKQGLFHFEYRTYPEIALREALMNAFCHADFRLPGPIMIRHFDDRIEIHNPGGFIGGISPENILHHNPVPRNPLLVDALTRLRLVNRSSLGIQRMFQAMLIEGKHPPQIDETGQAVRVSFAAQKIHSAFREFVAEESKKGIILSVDHLLILRYLLFYTEIDTPNAARICQRKPEEARNILHQMEINPNYLERGGTGKGTYWRLHADIFQRLSPEHLERDARIDWESAKTKVLSILKQRAKNNQPGLVNSEIRQITRLDRKKVWKLMQELIEENPAISKPGKGRTPRYYYKI